MSDAILVGPVSTRRHHRLHLAESGRAHCGAGRGLVLRSTPLQAGHHDLLCRRCIRAIRQAIADASQIAAAAESRYNDRDVRELAELGEALETPAEKMARARKHAEMVERIRADLRANGTLLDRMAATVELAPAVQPRRADARARTWADLRDQFADAHQRQLALTTAA